MEINLIKRFLIFTALLSLVKCKEPETTIDPRDQLIGSYNLRGTSRFVFDAFGSYNEYTRNDSAIFFIEKTKSSDSLEYVILNGAVIDSGPQGYSIGLIENGHQIIAKVEGLHIIIPIQLPYAGSSLSIEGNGLLENNTFHLTYKSFYRGSSRYADLKGIR